LTEALYDMASGWKDLDPCLLSLRAWFLQVADNYVALFNMYSPCDRHYSRGLAHPTEIADEFISESRAQQQYK